MDSTMLEQFLYNENVQGGYTIYENDNFPNNVRNQGISPNTLTQGLNKLKLSEYLQKEQDLLNKNQKVNFQKKSYMDLTSNLSSLSENIEKYFILPTKLKDNKLSKKFIIKQKDI